MADIAAIFHWSPGDMATMSLGELLMWRELAVSAWNRMHGKADG